MAWNPQKNQYHHKKLIDKLLSSVMPNRQKIHKNLFITLWVIPTDGQTLSHKLQLLWRR